MAREKVNTLTLPSNNEAQSFIAEAIDFNCMVMVSGVCAVDYEGRASSYFGYSDCLIILKPDGTFLVHQRDGRQPTNWQPSGCEYKAVLHNGELVIIGRRTSPEERLEVRFADVYSVSSYDIDEPVEKSLFGTEQQMQDRIMESPDCLEAGFEPVEAERSIEVGSIDVFGYDSTDVPVIVELKRRRAGPDAVDQLKRYVNTYGESFEEVRGILVAPSFTDTTEAFLSDEGLEQKQLEPRTDNETPSSSLGAFEDL